MKKVINTNAILENSPSVQAQIEEFLEGLDAPMKAVMQIGIAFDEIFSNIVFYAYNSKGGPCEIVLEELSCEDGKHGVSVSFIDEGPFYNPLEREDPDISLSAEERQIGGLGVLLVKKQMDDVSYEYKDNQNRLKLIKYF